jgi:hypothetical protein
LSLWKATLNSIDAIKSSLKNFLQGRPAIIFDRIIIEAARESYELGKSSYSNTLLATIGISKARSTDFFARAATKTGERLVIAQFIKINQSIAS